ncbi:MAG: glycoside hydrolase family 9 protein [Oscillospiraceae bacterium]
MGNAKKNLAKIAALCLTAATAVTPIAASAGQLLGETTFDKKGLPWHVCESSPGKMEFDISGGVYTAKIVNPGGKSNGGDDRWDCQFRHRGLVMRASDKYTIKYELTADKAGKFYTKIGNLAGDVEVWHNNCTGSSDFDQKWDCISVSANEKYSMECTFSPTKDVEVAEWAFHLGGDGQWTSGGCFSEGTTIVFDNMSLTNDSRPDDDYVDEGEYVIAGVEVNQTGYYTNLQKQATVVVDSASAAPQSFTVKDGSGNTVYTGTTSATIDDADSGMYVQVADFSDLTEEGTDFTVVCGNSTSLPFNIGNWVYDGLFTNAVNYYYLNRSGVSLDSKYITSGDTTALAAKAGHNPDKAYIQNEWKDDYASDGSDIDKSNGQIDVTGGWYDAGDHGKYVVNGGISVWTLNNMYERSIKAENSGTMEDGADIKIPESGNGIPDILDETKIELDFFLKMQRDDGMVYHKMHDYKWTALAVRPEEDDLIRIVKPVTTAATLNVAATAAQAARLWEQYDPDYADTLLTAAKKAYEAAKKDPENYASMTQDRGGGAYGDNEVKDDFYWAACELYITTGDSSYLTDMKGYKDAFKVVNNLSGGENSGSFSSFNWGCTAGLGTLSLALHGDKLDAADKQTVYDSIVAVAQSYVDEEDKQGFGIPYRPATYTDKSITGSITGYEWGSNSFVINNCLVMAYAYDITGNMDYINGVATGMDYIMGRNPLEQSYVTGYGEHATTYPHHRFWSYQLDKTFPMAPAGVLSGGPNSAMQDPWIKGMGYKVNTIAPQLCYLDHIESWSTNEVTINWNAPLAWTVSFLQDVAPTAEEGKKAAYVTGEAQQPEQTTASTSASETTTTTKATEASESTTTTKATDNTQSTPDPDLPAATVWGDTNVDGEVDVRDVTMGAQALVKMKELTPQGLANGDVCPPQDGVFDVKDLSQIKKFLINTITSLDPTK